MSELYETLKELEEQGKLKEGFLKVLVGLYADRNLHGLYEFAKNAESARKAKESFLDSIKNAPTSEELDTESFYQQEEFFLRLLE